MEPEKESSKKIRETPKRLARQRFQIETLEERIAPNKGGVANGGSGGHDCHRDPICK